MFGSSKIRELEKRIERLEYKAPESLEKFYESWKYTSIDFLYWLDQEWFIEELQKRGCLIVRDGFLGWKIQINCGGWHTDYARGTFVGEIYEHYLRLKESMHPQSKETKKKK